MGVKKLKLLKVLKNDYASFLSVIGALVFSALAIYASFGGSLSRSRFGYEQELNASDAPFLVYAALVTTIVALAVIARRLARFRRIYANGELVSASVRSFIQYRDRGRIEYEYRYGDSTYLAGQGIHRTADASDIRLDGSVAITVNRDRPAESAIDQLFT